MNINIIFKRQFALRVTLLLTLILIVVFASSRLQADTGTCGGRAITLPFTDVPAANGFFCQIASAFFSGLSNGTTATTYSPSDPVTREQMAAFVSRTLEQSIRRNNLRAVTKKWYLPRDLTGITLTVVDSQPDALEFDGTDIWVANVATIQRLRTSDGQILQTFTEVTSVQELVAAGGRIFATGDGNPGRLYFIDPTAGAGPVSTLLNNLPANPTGIAFDGARVWTANASGSVSIITINPPNATNMAAGFTRPQGILFDGANMWVTDAGQSRLLKLDANGNVVQSIPVGSVGNTPRHMVFDGINIWVSNNTTSSITVVRVKDTQGNALATPFVLATLTGNGLDRPNAIAFDGERILVANGFAATVSLFKAADLTPLGSIQTGINTFPSGACSDGMNFWVTFNGTDRLARF
jgi:hypothetical protein